jgi:hypothetical protein
MIQTRRVRHRQTAEGAYGLDAFCIRIESDPPLINPTTLAIRTDDAEDFSTFVHEYWHYLQNLTTVAGFSSFELFHDLAARFHETLVNNVDGTSIGSVGIHGTHGQVVQELLEIMRARRGEGCPAGIDNQDVAAFDILDVTIDEYALTRNGQQVPLSRVLLAVRVHLKDGTAADADVLFGQLCIEEGIAYEIDRMVAGGGPGTPAVDNASPFPYLVLRELACARSDVDVHRIDLIALATLSLLTTDPAVNFLNMLDDFGVRRTAGETVAQALDGIWQSLRTHSEQVINLIIDHDMPSIVADYQGRGLLQHAVEYLAENYTDLLRRRLQNPFFDIHPFTNNNLNREVLEQLFRQILPCDTIQSLSGDEHAVTRDLLVTFGVPPERWTRLGYRPADFLRTLECQVDYLFAHLCNSGFLASANTDSRCPFYSVCGLSLRRDHPELCRESPWEAFDPGQPYHCWYGTAVASTLGIVVMHSLVGDPSIPERERAAIHAAVQGRAHEIWESEHRPNGCDWAHWLQAKAELGVAQDVII